MTDVDVITDATQREIGSRIVDLERQVLLEEARRLEGTDLNTSPRPGDPPQPDEAPPVPETEVARRAPLTAERILNRALSREGYREPSKDVSEFGAWYGLNPAAWCAMFVSWVFHTEGLPLPARTPKGFAYCGDGVNYFKARGQWKPVSTRPEPGWVIFFNWAETPKEPFDHVGLVVGVNSNGSIRTIEGNTTPPNGVGADGVFRKDRRVGILGYGAPTYAVPPTPASSLPVLNKADHPTGAPVRRLQGLLRAADPSLTDTKLPLTGTFDDRTLQCVKDFQSAHPPLKPYGDVGPLTWGALLGLKRA